MARIPRLAAYGLLSTLGASAVVGSAIRSKPNFYTAAVTIGQSSGALMVLANFMLFNVICFGVGVKALFFGRLRRVEYEHLFERLWIFLTESLLAMTIFRDDFSVSFAIMFGVLVFLKCFHWITADRVDYMDQVPHPGPPIIFHLRISTILVLLAAVDACLVLYALESLLFDGVSATILFASEFMILFASCAGIAARYTVGVVDIRRTRGDPDAPAWEGKGMCLFYIDLAVDFVKLLTYLAFFLAILLSYGLPLHILRDVYMTLRSFLSRVQDLIRYRRATKDMDNLYPNATHAEMQGGGGDGVCIICREEMVAVDAPPPGAEEGELGGEGEGQRHRQQQHRQAGPNETPKKLQCGHIFHFHCLRSWLERQQSCPTCRRDVLRPPTITHPRARNNPPFPLATPQVQAAPAAGPQPGQAPIAATNPAQTALPTHTGANPTSAPATESASPSANPTVQPAQPTLRSLQGAHDGQDEAGEAARMREAFEQYFRFPGSGFGPTRATPLSNVPASHNIDGGAQDQGQQLHNTLGGTGVAGPSRSNGTTATAIPTQSTYTSAPEVERHRQVQRGIWGGPIEVGRFFVPPLGAAPRFTVGGGGVGVNVHGDGHGYATPRASRPWPHAESSGTGTAAGSRGLDELHNAESLRAGQVRVRGRDEPFGALPEIRLPSEYRTQGAGEGSGMAAEGGPLSGVSKDAESSSAHQQAAATNQTSTTGAPSSTLASSSGDRTPAYSNPPTVFRSLSATAPRPTVHTTSAPDSQGHGDKGGEDDEDDVEVVQLSEEERRRAVAEAAAKRLGLASTEKGKGKAPASDAEIEAMPVNSRAGDLASNGASAVGSGEGAPYLSLPHVFGRLEPTLVQDSGTASDEGAEEEMGGDEEAELEMARLLSVALDQGRPLHLRHPTFGGQSNENGDGSRTTAPEPYTEHAESGEVERLRSQVERLEEELDRLRRSKEGDAGGV